MTYRELISPQMQSRRAAACAPRARAIQRCSLLAACCAVVAGMAACGDGKDEDKALPAGVTFSQLCGLPAPATEAARLPEPTGGHCVGKASFSLVDANRPEPFTADPQDHRELGLKVWYPIAPKSSAPRADYAEAETFALVLSDTNDRIMRTNSRRDAAMALGAKYPVVLFSPGLGMVAEYYSGLLEEIASHGYVVVGINHPSISGVTVLPNGRAIPIDGGFLNNGGNDDVAQIAVDDQRSVIDWLQTRDDDRVHPLRFHLDMSRIGTIGHSIGGSASLQSARVDSRIKAAINLDGSVYGTLTQPWSKPIMLYSSSNKPADDPSMRTVFDSRRGPGEYKVLENSSHRDFTEIKLLLRPLLARYSPAEAQGLLDKLNFGAISAEAAMHAIRGQTLPFLNSYVRQ